MSKKNQLKEETKKKGIELPKYTLAEELISSISHGVGALLSIVALVLCIVFSSFHHNPLAVIASAIYGVTLLLLYLASCLYHAFKRNKAKKVFRVFDHCSIFLLIAGSYTPYTLLAIGGIKGILICIIIWVCAIIGIVLNAVNLKKYEKISMVLYLAMGWTIILALDVLVKSLGSQALIFLVLGGVLYTVGAVIYGIGSKVKYMHSVWHFFVLGGSILHFFSIFLYVI